MKFKREYILLYLIPAALFLSSCRGEISRNIAWYDDDKATIDSDVDKKTDDDQKEDDTEPVKDEDKKEDKDIKEPLVDTDLDNDQDLIEPPVDEDNDLITPVDEDVTLEPEYIPEGVWAAEIITDGLMHKYNDSNVPWTTKRYYIFEIKNEAGELLIDKSSYKLCHTVNYQGDHYAGAGNKAVTNYNLPNYKYTVKYTLYTPTDIDDFKDSDVFVDKSEDLPKFDIPNLYETRGINFSNVVTDKMPTEDDDPRIYDQDMDGKIGITVHYDGVIDGEIYLVQRLRLKLQGAFTDETHLAGKVDWSSDEYEIWSPQPGLRYQRKFDMNKESSNFKMTKLDKVIDCQNYIADLNEIFKEESKD
jgi:hypothetical protein